MTPPTTPRWPSLLRQAGRFGVVGGLGFMMDAGTLSLLMTGLDFGHYQGRAVSFTTAVLFTWLLNRTFTFGRPLRDLRRPKRVLTEFGTYLSLQSLGMVLNLGIYVALIAHSSLFFELPVLAVAAGSVAAMIFNFATARWIAFRPSQRRAGPRGDGT